MVADFREVNEQLKYLHYQLMRIDRIFYKFHGTKLFSTLDIKSGCFNITVSEKSRNYTAFTREYGRYRFFHVPFGLHIAPSNFGLMINETFKVLDFCFAYLVEFIIWSETEKEHLDHIRQVFNSLHNANTKLKLTKCDFLKSQKDYLGHLLSQ